MLELTLHFKIEDDADLKAVASQLEESMSALPDVEAAESDTEVLRAIGLPEILTMVTLGIAVANNVTTLLKALKDMLQAYSILAKRFPGLHLPTIEVGSRKVPLDKVTEQDARELLAAE